MPGAKLTEGAELLFRHVGPAFIRDGRPSNQAFAPTKKDAGLLSVNRAALTTAGDAFALFTAADGFACKCEGTWGITVAECASTELAALADPLEAPPEPTPNPAHAVVDFRELSRKNADRRGVKLAQFALARGRQHPPAPTGGESEAPGQVG